MKNKNKFLAASMIVIMMLVIFLGNQVYASGNDILDSLEIVGKKDKYNPGDVIVIKGEWSIPDDTMDKVYMAGDGFSIPVPEGFITDGKEVQLGGYGVGIYNSESQNLEFTFNESIEKLRDRKGGFEFSLKIIEDLEGQEVPIIIEDKGTIYIDETIVVGNNQDQEIDQDNNLKPIEKDKLGKWGTVSSEMGVVKWQVRINYDSELDGKIIVHDKLYGNHILDKNSFSIREEYTDGYTHNGEKIKVNGKSEKFINLEDLKHNISDTEYSLELDIKEYGVNEVTNKKIKSFYTIEYSTIYTGIYPIPVNEELKNNISIKSDDDVIEDKNEVVKISHSWAHGQSGRGNFKIFKVDSKTNKPISGAKFSLNHRMYNSENREITIGDEGFAELEEILDGPYILKEVEAPDGYQLSSEKYYINIIFNETKEFEYTVKNDPIPEPIDLFISKEWFNEDGEEISDVNIEEISLILISPDGDEKEVVLTKEENWEKELKGLSPEGDNKYQIKELEVPGYELIKIERVGDRFIIKNKEEVDDKFQNNVDLSISKKWLNKDGEEISEVSVDSIEVLVEGTDGYEKTVELSSANDWTIELKDLDLLDKDGEEIVYTVKELTKVDGFKLDRVDGDSYNFTLVNKEEETEEEPPTPEPKLIDLTVSKKWLDIEEKEISEVSLDSIEVLVEGTDGYEKTVELSSANDWTIELKDLAYMDSQGNLVEYTVKELTKVDGFKLDRVDGDSYNFTLVNKEEETEEEPPTPQEPPTTPEEPPTPPVVPGDGERSVDLSISKKWLNKDGEGVSEVSVDSIEVLVEGTDGYEKTVELSSANDWTIELKDLAYKDSQGNLVEYTVKELTKVDGFELDRVDGDSYNFTLVNKEEETEEEPPTPEEPTKPNKPSKPNKPKRPRDPEPKDPVDPDPVDPTEPNEPEETPDPEDPEDMDPVVPEDLSGYNRKDNVIVEGKNPEIASNTSSGRIDEKITTVTRRESSSEDVLPKTGENRNANYIFGMLFILIGIILKKRY